MDGSAIKEVERLAQQAAAPSLVVDGITYTARPYTAVLPPEAKVKSEPDTLKVHTLTGIADYVRENKDSLVLEGCLLVVEDVDKVALVDKLTGPHLQRFEYARADGYRRCTFQFGQFMGVEEFTIGLLSQFEDVGQRADVLKIIGNVADENVVKQTDNGFGQSVNVKSSIGLDTVAVPNPVSLAPYRTFPDIGQPESPFVLRVRKGQGGITAALFEGDGGAWRVDAVKRIKRWLNGELPDIAVIA